MRIMNNGHQQLTTSTAAYRLMDDHKGNFISEKGISDEDDDDVDAERDLTPHLNLCRPDNGDGVGSPHHRMENEKRLRREIANSNERRRMQSINAGFQSLKALLPRRDGEKMSKASILQQTADFIRSLQSDKETLQRQTNEMKQLLDVSSVRVARQTMDNNMTYSCIPKTETPSTEKRPAEDYRVPMIASPPKKRRKFDNDSADEGLGMMSDVEACVGTVAATQTEPSSITTDASCCTTPYPNLDDFKTTENPLIQEKLWEIEILQRQLIEIRLALDRERRTRLVLEEQLRISEMNRLQALSHLQSASLSEYNSSANSIMSIPRSILSPAPAKPSNLVQCATPALMSTSVAASTTSASSMISSFSTVIESAALDASLPNPVPVRMVTPSTTGDIVKPLPTSNATTSVTFVSQPSTLPSSLPAVDTPSSFPSLGHTTPNATNDNSLSKQTNSKQSLAAIVEAIRHLEGDQLFVDVELQRSVKQHPSTSTITPIGIVTTMSSFGQPVTSIRQDYTDSGISSPISERHLLNVASAALGNGAVLSAHPMPRDGNASMELNHVVAATAAALHNLCFPYANPHQLLGSSASRSQQFQRQLFNFPPGWNSRLV